MGSASAGNPTADVTGSRTRIRRSSAPDARNIATATVVADPSPRTTDAHLTLGAGVAFGLGSGYRLRLEGRLQISHETIYRYIWADKAAGGTLYTHLRGARKQRRKRYGRYDSRAAWPGSGRSAPARPWSRRARKSATGRPTPWSDRAARAS